MEEDPVIILLGSELNSMQSYRLSVLPHPRLQLLPWTCWTVRCNHHVGMVHQLHFFCPNALTELEGCVSSKTVKNVTALSQNILQHEGKGCAANDTLSNHRHHVLYFWHRVWKHPAVRWAVCSNCSRQNIPLSMGMWECHEIINVW